MNQDVYPCCSGGDRVLEPIGCFVDSTGVLVARAVVSTNQGEVPIQLLNCRGETTVKSGTVVVELADLDQGGERIICGVVPVDRREQGDVRRQTDQSHIDGRERKVVEKLLNEYQDVFSSETSGLGKCNVVEHPIPTGSSTPIKQLPKRVPHALRREVDEQIDGMLKDDVIRPSNSPWSSPVVLVRKKNGSIRFCLDYRKLNAVTLKDS